MNDLKEKFAAIEHERWADWQRHLHSKCTENEQGDLIIPNGYKVHLERQINTPYADLSEEEKQSDRREVDRYWPLVQDVEVAHKEDRKADRERITELEDTNRQLCFNLDEAQKVVEAMNKRMAELSQKVSDDVLPNSY